MKKYKDKKWLEKKYSEEKLSMKKIAELGEGSKSTIYKYLKKFNIYIRSLNESHLGKHPTEETRNKIREKMMGNTYALGNHLSEETKNKMRKRMIGNIPGNKGMHLSNERKQKMSERLRGCFPWNTNKLLSKEHKQKIGLALRGEKSSFWKGGITPLERLVRTIFEYRQWRSDVFTRDDFTCQKCDNKGHNLNAHHIKPFSKIIQFYEITTLDEALNCEELWNINNGITLCEKCHIKIYKKSSEMKVGEI